jgi:hypothetical protein
MMVSRIYSPSALCDRAASQKPKKQFSSSCTSPSVFLKLCSSVIDFGPAVAKQRHFLNFTAGNSPRDDPRAAMNAFNRNFTVSRVRRRSPKTTEEQYAAKQ